jgi:hypothetical protein
MGDIPGIVKPVTIWRKKFGIIYNCCINRCWIAMSVFVSDSNYMFARSNIIKDIAVLEK